MPNISTLAGQVFWLAIIGLIVLLASRYASKAAARV